MAEGFEPYHVPQQSRRDKLRIVAQNNHPSTCVVESTAAGALHQALLPLYDSSLLSSDLLNCANNTSTTSHHHHHDFHHHNHNPLSGSAQPIKTNPVCVVKDEGANLMSFVGGTSHHHHPYLDPHSSLNMNPSSIQDINNNPFLYSPHNLQSLRDFDHHQSYNSVSGGEVVLFKPEPLSLSLSSHSTAHQNNLPLELNLQRFSSTIGGGGGGGGGGYVVQGVVGGGGGSASTSNDASRSSVPLGPFTGYASILKGSRFLKPAQQLLEEFCNVGQGIYAEKITADSSLMDPPLMNLSSSGVVDDDPLSSGDGNDNRRKKSRLISMLDEVSELCRYCLDFASSDWSVMMESGSISREMVLWGTVGMADELLMRLFEDKFEMVYRRYKQYYQQMQAVVASFEYVAGLGNAAPFANLALKTMSKHFKCLKNAITDQLQFTNNNKTQVQMNHGKDEAPRFGNADRSLFRPVQNSGFLERQPVWRPQRGLPERAVTVLRAWLFEHFLHPYPTDTDKLMLAKQTGLSRSQVCPLFSYYLDYLYFVVKFYEELISDEFTHVNQVSNWFINARVRLWKPMVEEIHMLETRQAQKSSQREDRNANRISDCLPPSNTLPSEHPSTSAQRVPETPSKRTIHEFSEMPVVSHHDQQPPNLSYHSLSSHHPHVSLGGSSGVSLTLGLHQNNAIGLSEPYHPINGAQRFGLGLETNNEGYVLGGYEAQTRHFGRDVMGGQLLHDFVG
ncbi:hypothetical protein EZV62_016528 [Acer yangbiense]|uniref:Homeobox domain-containing protein n=1 Tax=Acer yangbiense TaxID=1000413 RepID=A0A5C7HPE3_9ROSI|nr:hypothetical protein EZV62_016528 [Acer yangbiense]